MNPGTAVPTAELADSLAPYQVKLHTIAREMELCKTALSEWRLNVIQAETARELIEAIEAGVDQLSDSVSAQLGALPESKSPPIWRIDDLLDHLAKLCEELMSTIFCRRPAPQLHA